MKTTRKARTMIASIRTLVILFSMLLLMASGLNAATYTVTSTFDAGAGSLRQAIIDANANAGTDNINFSIPGAGPHIITLGSALPVITGPVVINGYSEPGSYVATANYQAKILIVVDFSNLPGTGLFLNSTASGSSISGLSIVNAGGGSSKAIYLNNASNCNIFGNYLGIYPDGSAGGNYVGVHVFGGDKNNIGNGAVANRNIISFNNTYGVLIQNDVTNKADSNNIHNNYIGTNAKGIADFGNRFTGILIQNSDYTNIYDNIISGNNANGIYLQGTASSNVDSTRIQRNRIGINASSDSLANLGHGILMEYASNTLIGGSSGNMNTIAFNGIGGVTIGLGSASVGNEISYNAIYRNTRLGIDLSDDGVSANDADDSDSGPNDLQNFPVIDSAKVTSGTTLTVWGNFLGINAKNYRLEFFNNPAFIGVDASGNGEGYASIHTLSVAGTGAAQSFSFTLSNVSIYNDYITATATELSTKSTSEFSAVKIVNSVIDYVCDDTGPWTRTYQVSAVPQATSYTWSVPPGASITAGQNTTNVTVDWQGVSVGSYQVCVVANSTCGTSPSSCYPVVVQLCCVEPVVNAMTTTVCSGAAISVTLPTTPVTGTTITSYNINAVVNGGMGGTATTGTGITSTSAIFNDAFTNTSNTTQTVVYTVTPYSYSCSGPSFSITVTVNPVPTLVDPSDATICSGDTTNIVLTTNITGPTVSYAWSGALTSGTVTGFGSGTTSTIEEELNNTGSGNGVVTYTITPSIGSCTGTQQTVAITVRPVDLITTCPETRAISGCNTSAITSPAYSTTAAGATQAVFTSAPNNGVLNSVCGIDTITYIDVASSSCPITVTRTWTVTDDYGNTETCQQTIEVDDNTAPSITCPSAITGIQCASSVPSAYANAAAFITAGGSLSDNCGGTLTLTSLGDVVDNVTCTNRYTITRTYQVTDACGNTATCEQALIVYDNTAPTATAPANITGIKCISGIPAADVTLITDEADNCGGTPTVTLQSTSNNGGSGCSASPYILTRTYRITDACGNFIDRSHTITVIDDVNPTATAPANITGVKCIADIPAANPAVVTTEADNCGTPTVAFQSASNNGGSGCTASPYILTRTYRVTDACGNTVDVSHTITVIDDVAPTASNPTNITGIKCIADIPAADPAVVTTEADNCGTPTVAFQSASNNGGTGCVGDPYILTRVYRVTDACGNTVDVSHTITVIDDVAPTASNPSNITGVKCIADIPAADPAVVTTEADNCGTPTVAFQSASNNGGTGCIGDPYILTRVYRVTDACGNTVDVSHTITVIDDVAPLATAPTTIDIECGNAAPVGATTYAGFIALGGTTSDNCTANGSLVIAYTDGALVGTNCNGTITRSYTVTDACGNTTTVNQTITVTDNTFPLATAPTTIDIECGNAAPVGATTYAGFIALGGTTSDNCTANGSLVIAYTDGALVGTNCNGTITRSYTVTDACGNTTTVNQTITVTDNTFPLATAPTTIDIECGNAAPAGATTYAGFITLGGTTSDNCTANGSLVIAYTDGALVGTNCNGTITRSYTVTDACGNTTTVNQTITVTDNTFPLATAPTTIDIECGNAAPTGATTYAGFIALGGTTSDNCTANGSLVIAYTDGALVGTNCNGTITRSYTVTDACGNTTTVNQTITVTDNTNPTATAPTMVDLECAADLPAAATTIAQYLSLTGAAATDNCTAQGSLTVSSVDAVTTTGSCAGVITRTYTITDACGNAKQAFHIFTVTDNTFPLATAPTTIDIECGNAAPAGATTYAGFIALGGTTSDNCTANGSLVIAYTDGALVGTNCNGTITRSYTVTDACGNTTTVNQTITVTDNTFPLATAPTTIDIECGNAAPTGATTYAGFIALGGTTSDNCTASGSLAIAYTDGPLVGTNCNGTITRSYTVTDACGNTTTVNQTITVTDNTFPLATAPTTIDIECGNAAPVGATTYAGFIALGGTTSDNCTANGSLVIAYTDGALVGTNCNGTITRSYTVTDACGNTTTVNQTITVTDNTFPLATAPTTTDIECGNAAPVGATTYAGFIALGGTTSDNCTASGSLAIAYTDGPLVGTNCNGTITRSYTVTDACGNTTTVNQTITVTDNTFPLATAPTTIDIECGNAAPVGATTYAGFIALGGTTSDNCTANGSLAIAYTDGPLVGTNCNGTITRSYTVTDACGNTTTVNQTITVTDNTFPLATAPTTIDIECGNAAPAGATTYAGFIALGGTTSDNCTANGSLAIAYTDGPLVGTNCNGTITRSYTVTDACGNTTTVNQTITVTDNTFPLATAPTTIDIECGNAAPVGATTYAGFIALGGTTSDNCTASGSLAIAYTDGPLVGTNCNGTITRSYTVTDACGNTTTVNQTITVTDNTFPLATAPTTIDIECGNAAPVGATTYAGFIALGGTTSDNCTANGSLAIAYTDGPLVGTNCNGTITRSYTVTDACGNTTTVNQTITVTDNTFPLATAPTTIDIECGNAAPVGATTYAGFIALGGTTSDNCTANGSLVIAYTDGALVGTNCNGTITRSYTVTDACGNTTTVNQTITVTDNTFPLATAPTTIDIECGNAAPVGATTYAGFIALGGTTSDNCTANGSLVIAYTDGALVGTNCNGTITRSYTVTDACGNTTTVNQTITVTDNTFPLATAPTTIDIECGNAAPAGATTYAGFIALGGTTSDNCTANGSLAIAYTDGPLVGTNCNGTITRSYTVTDACGNTTTVNQTITVTDNTFPLATAPTTIDIECGNAAPVGAATYAGFIALGGTTSDNCTASGSLAIAYTDGPLVGTNCNGTITRSYTVTDACGNTTTVNQTITVTDNTFPLATAPTTIDIECGNAAPVGATTYAGFIALGGTTSDNCTANGSLAIAYTDGPLVGTNCNGTITRSYTVTDACGNTTTVNQTITVTDNTFPLATAPTTIDIECGNAAPAGATTYAGFIALGGTTSDNCTASGSLTIAYTDGPLVGTNCNGTITRSYTVTDACGNTTTVNQTITVTDNTFPLATAPTTIDIECGNAAPVGATTYAGFIALGGTTSDNCTASGSLAIAYTDGPLVGTNCNGTITRSYTVTDACGNTTTVNQTITVTDNTFPLATAPTTIDIECGNAAPVGATTYAGFIALGGTTSDNCTANGSLAIAYTDGPLVGTNCNGTITRSYTVTDACGNTTTVNQTITVTDNTFPLATAPTTIDIECGNAAPVGATTYAGFIALGGTTSDNCTASGSLAIAYTDGPLVGTNCNGTITRSYTVTDACGNTTTVNQTITVTDNTVPTFTRPADITLYKNASCTVNDTPTGAAGDVTNEADNCSTGLNATYSDVVVNNCTGTYTITRTWSLVDACGNAAANQVQTITVEDITPPNVITQPITIYLNASGIVTIAEDAVNNGSNDNCSPVLSYDTDITGFDCSDQGANTVVLTVTDNCGNTATATAIVTVLDNTLPTIVCPANISQSTDPGLCRASVAVPNPVIADNCAPTRLTWVISGVTTGSSPAIGINYVGTRDFNKGVSTVTYTVRDAAGNTSSCSFTVTINDTEKPNAICKNTSVNLSAAGTVSITPSQVNNGSTDNCGVTGLAVTPNSFNCSNVGVNTVVLTVYDAVGNASTCAASVTVNDVTPPAANCQNITVALDASGNAVIVPAQVNNGSTDNCSVASLSLNKTNFTCADIGTNNVVLTVTDASGNTSTCQSTVTITNPFPPSVSVNDVTVWENAGTANFSISIDKLWPCDVTVQINTSNNTASSGLDYTGLATTWVTIPAGSTSYALSIPILVDNIVEISETYFVNILAANGALIADAQGIGTILDDDVTTLSIGNATEYEGTSLIFDAALTNPSSTPVTFTPVLSNGSALVGTDTQGPLEYSFDGGLTWIPYTSGDITIPPMTTSLKFKVGSVNDILDEGTENFNITLNVTSGNTTNASTAGIGTILDNDLVISGKVMLDANKLLDLTVNGTGTNGGGTVYANLLDPITNQVLATVPVDASGNYAFNSNIDPITANTAYLIRLSNGPTVPATILPAATLNLLYNFGGENVGTGPGSDGVVDGSILVSTTTEGLVNVNFGIYQVPDLTPIITVVPSVMHGTTNYYITVKVMEMNSIGAEGTIVVRIPKDNRWNFNGQYDPALNNLGPFVLNNYNWTYTQDTLNHIFTSSAAISGGSYTMFGFQVTWSAGQTRGIYTITTQIDEGSGGERRFDNNVDAEKIDYFIY